MRDVYPEVFLVSRPSIDWDGVRAYLEAVDSGYEEFGTAHLWPERDLSASDAEVLTEFGGRLCYRSWDVGMNANVTRVREDSAEYLANILRSGHGSVLEHAQFSFALHNVSRVFTHELVRHRVGVGISQESLRFVRLTDIPMWEPEWLGEHFAELRQEGRDLVAKMEHFQRKAAHVFGLDDPGVPFSEKKAKTSWMRRYAPDGLATSLLWSANIRTLRWVVEARTAPHAEEEIRLVFHQVAELAARELPSLFGDFVQVPVDGSSIPAWAPANRKV